MIVLDTNVVSETVRPRPDAVVEAWLARHSRNDVRLTATVVAELLAGVERMPEGRRRILVSDAIDLILDRVYESGVIPFDLDAARAYAVLFAARARAGRPISVADAQIAAVCLVNDATLATRNVRDFDGCGIRVVDPWAPDAAQ